MKKHLSLFAVLLMLPASLFAAGMEDDPLLAMLVVEQLELRADREDPIAWDAEGWVGKDLHKLRVKTEGESADGRVEEMEVQALYSPAVAPFWDLQLGWKHDVRPRPHRDWLVLGIKGLAPYYIDIDASLFLGDSGRTGARLQAEYELMLTQKWVLVPEIELNLFGKNDPETGNGSGLSDLEAGLRLHYGMRREFAPYIGMHWSRLFGNTSDYAREEGESTEDMQMVLGVRFWF